MIRTLSADQFFNAMVACLRLRNVESLAINEALDRAFAEAFTALKGCSNSYHFRLPFRIFPHPTYGDSALLRELIDAGSKNNIVDVANPYFKRMKPKLSASEAEYFLESLPVPRAVLEEIACKAFKELAVERNGSDAAR